MESPRVPAWKRLGLKLKYAKDVPENNEIQTNSNGASTKVQDEPPTKKRRLSPEVSTNGLSKSAPSEQLPNSMKLKKKVSFSSDTKTLDGDTSAGVAMWNMDMVEAHLAREAEIKEAEKNKLTTTEHIQSDDLPSPQLSEPKKVKKPKTKKSQPQPAKSKLHDGLLYLEQFVQKPEQWKFNKNREIWILKHALSTIDIPILMSSELADYLHGLKSTGARTRLIQECRNVLRYPSPDSPIKILPDGSVHKTSSKQDKSMPLAVRDELGPEKGLDPWSKTESRAQLLLRCLDATMDSTTRNSNGTTPRTNGTEPKPKKKKNRTAVVEYSSSSSSESSDDEDDSDSDSESKKESTNGISNKDKKAEETSSSGSSSESSSESDSD